MKFIKVLIFLIFNSTFWSLINSVKNKKELGTSKDLTQILNGEGAESSSVNPQIQKYKETLNPKFITKEEEKLRKKGYNKNYRQKNKDKLKENKRKIDKKYYQKNKEKINENNKNYYQKNKDKLKEIRNSAGFKENKRKSDRKYYQNNQEKLREKNRKYRLKKKNEKEILQNDCSSKLGIIHSGGETSFVSPQNNISENKGKEPIVSEENFQVEDGHHPHKVEDGHHDHQLDVMDDFDLSFLDDPNFCTEFFKNF